MSAMSVNMTVTALVGQMLSEDPALATLPLALQFTATMCTTMPASLLMRRIGRQAGFAIGVLVGVSGALLAMAMIFERHFAGFLPRFDADGVVHGVFGVLPPRRGRYSQ